MQDARLPSKPGGDYRKLATLCVVVRECRRNNAEEEEKEAVGLCLQRAALGAMGAMDCGTVRRRHPYAHVGALLLLWYTGVTFRVSQRRCGCSSKYCDVRDRKAITSRGAS